jgi:hypothetical protein
VVADEPSAVYTDELKSYKKVGDSNTIHASVNHRQEEWGRGDVSYQHRGIRVVPARAVRRRLVPPAFSQALGRIIWPCSNTGLTTARTSTYSATR